VSQKLHPSELAAHEWQILQSVRELQFGVVEVVVHDRRVTEVRQTRRTRLTETAGERQSDS